MKTVKKSMAESLAPPLNKDPGIQGRQYGAETWVLYRRQIRLLERFKQRCLRSILGIKWQDRVSNEEVLKRASLPSIESILLQVQLRWAGHVTRMQDVRMPKAVFFSELQEGECGRGAPKKRTQIS